jgi:hypothetical protein
VSIGSSFDIDLIDIKRRYYSFVKSNLWHRFLWKMGFVLIANVKRATAIAEFGIPKNVILKHPQQERGSCREIQTSAAGIRDLGIRDLSIWLRLLRCWLSSSRRPYGGKCCGFQTSGSDTSAALVQPDADRPLQQDT